MFGNMRGNRRLNARARSLVNAKTISLISIASLSLAACGSSSSGSATTTTAAPATTAPATLQTITLSEVGPDAGKLPIYAALSNGFFAKQGLKVVISDSNGSSQGVQAVLAGAVNIAEVGDTDAISAAAQGGSIELIAGEENKAPYTINVAPSIKKISDLVGKKTSPGSSPTNIATLYFNAVLQANSVNPTSTTPIYEGTTGDRFAALKGGVVAASLLLPPFNFEAVAAGYPSIADVGQFSTLPFTALAASPVWAKAHAKELQGFLTAYLQGIKWVYDSANRAETISISEKYTKATPAAAAQSYDFFVNLKTYPTDGQVLNLTDLIKVMHDTNSIKTLPAESAVSDMSFVNSAYTALQG